MSNRKIKAVWAVHKKVGDQLLIFLYENLKDAEEFRDAELPNAKIEAFVINPTSFKNRAKKPLNLNKINKEFRSNQGEI